MRIATYNVEWFTHLFDEDGRLLDDGGWSGRWDVTRAQQTEALAGVFTAMDADAVMVIEAPDTSRKRNGNEAMEYFADWCGIRARKALTGFHNQTQQEISLLYDPDVMTAQHDPLETPEFPRFDTKFRMDVDVDATPEVIRWSKPPLEVAVTTPNAMLRIIGVHAKSKAPHGVTDPDAIKRVAIENRRKQMAQCVWLRGRVAQHLAAGDDLIVLGDFNDGPGLDEYEKLFGKSGVEIVLGAEDEIQLFDPHAHMVLGRRLGAQPATARFKRKGEPYLSALLDYVMVSPGLRAKNPKWQIWHPFDHPDIFANAALREALLLASDHFPVVLDIDL